MNAPLDLGRLNLGGDARTLAASITNTLREAILRGQLKPGESLGQESLARQFGVSRIPVRESINQLASEGLVQSLPHRGAVVATLSVEELDELYGIVWSLEMLAARAGVPTMTDEQVAEMAHLLDRLDRERDPYEWYATNVRFHRQVLIASRQPRVMRIVDECRRNIGRYVIEPRFFKEQVEGWRKRNRALYQACRERNAERAVAALEVMRTISTSNVREHLRAELGSPKAKRSRTA